MFIINANNRMSYSLGCISFNLYSFVHGFQEWRYYMASALIDKTDLVLGPTDRFI